MILTDAEVHEAATLDQAAEMLARFGAGARLMMGGTDLLVDLKRSRIDVSHLVSLQRIGALRGITESESGVQIGAATTLTDLSESSVVHRRFPIFLDALRQMAGPQIRNVSTIGGNITSAVPSADLPPILMVLNARVTLWSREGERTLPLEAFFTGPRQTVCRHGEILTRISLPYTPARFGGAYERFSLREANALAVAGVAAGLVLAQDGKVASARIGLCAVAPTPKLVEAASLLVGSTLTDDDIARAASAAVEASRPRSSIRGSAEFRRALVDALTRRALETAGQRAKVSNSSLS
jgi:carbon-monoxide dehydrogenase medium subunit